MKINKLTLQNFKAYKDKTEFDFEGKNVLIFGTNGSGKSSMFKALQYLFKSSTQTLPDVQKYFSSEDAETVKNIYADAELESYVQLETVDKISEGNIGYSSHTLSNSTLADVKSIKLALSLSEFINYRLLFNFSQFGDYEDANVFDIFRREFFSVWKDEAKNATYEKLNDDEIVTYEPIAGAVNKIYTFEEWYLSLEDELSRLSTKKYNASTGREYNMHPKSSVYNTYKSKVEDFNNALKEEIIGLTRQVNKDLKVFLKTKDIRVFFEFKEPLSPDTENKRHWNFNRPIINLTLKYKEQTIQRPQIFLNEARLTALAFSIRLAAFKRRFKSEAEVLVKGLKVFVLDDILMSMDMSNRYLFFDFILNNEDLKDYQKIILTHEKDLYDMLVKMIEAYPNQDEKQWKQFELYENGLIKNKKGEDVYENPTILTDSLNHYDKAKAFFKIKDYPSCGNYQRKAAEREIKRILKGTKYILTGKDRTKEVDTLHTLVERLENYCTDFDFDFSPFQKLGVFSKIVLNKLSHDNLRSPVFRDELDEVFKILDELGKLKHIVIAKKDDNLVFKKQCQKVDDNRVYQLVVKLTDDLIVYHQAVSVSDLRDKKKKTAITKLVEPVVKPIELWIDGVKQENPRLSKTKRIGDLHQYNLERFLEIPEAERLSYEADYKIEKDEIWISLATLIETTINTI